MAMSEANGISNLARLKQIAEALPPTLPNLVQWNEKCFTQYKTDTGTILGFGIYKDDDVAVQRGFLSKGAKFPPHSHGVTEVITIVKGRLRTQGTEIGPTDLAPAQTVTYPPHDQHSHEALEDTWLIALTIPAAKGYPDGKQ
jgi:quercetin dioxygenase-like cupin family protein